MAAPRPARQLWVVLRFRIFTRQLKYMNVYKYIPDCTACFPVGGVA